MITNRPDWINYAYEKEPNIEMLKKALENEQWLITDRETKLKAIRLKYQAMTTVPTIIEKTMSTEQLYDAKSPLWARGHTVYELLCYVRYKASTTYKMVKSIIKMDSVIQKGTKMISDEFKQAQKTIIENHPNLCIELLKRNDGYQIISDYIKDTVKPNINVFKAFLNHPLTDRNDIGLITKYRAMTEMPSPIEKTMSEVQLFESNSPF